MTPTDCSAGPSAAAPPKANDAHRHSIGSQRAKITSATAVMPLTAGEALVPAAGIEQRQERAADAGEKAADHGGAQPNPQHGIAHRARGIRAFAGGADQQAPARGSKRPEQNRRERHADQEQHIDPQRRPHLGNVAPPAEINRRQARARSARSAVCRDRTPDRFRTASARYRRQYR